MVPYNIGYHGIFNIPVYIGKMIESLSALGMCRCFGTWKHTGDLTCHKRSIYHAVLGISRMNAYAPDIKYRLCCIKVLIFYLVLRTAVHGICKIRPELLKIKKLRTMSYLLVRCKSNTYPAMGQTAADHLLSHGHYLRNPRLIISPKKRASVRCDQCSPL